jgi:hypothetical protein
VSRLRSHEQHYRPDDDRQFTVITDEQRYLPRFLIWLRALPGLTPQAVDGVGHLG